MNNASAATSGMTLGTLARGPAHLAAAERVEQLTRQRFNLARDAVVVAVEIACQVPGCPPVETAIAFWGADGTRYRYKIFKPIAAVTADDLPVTWLLPSLVDHGEPGCDCC